MYSWRFPVLSTLRLYGRVGHRCQSALLQTGSLMLQTFRDLVLRPMFPGYGMMLGATSDSARGWLRVPLFGAAQFTGLVASAPLWRRPVLAFGFHRRYYGQVPSFSRSSLHSLLHPMVRFSGALGFLAFRS